MAESLPLGRSIVRFFCANGNISAIAVADGGGADSAVVDHHVARGGDGDIASLSVS